MAATFNEEVLPNASEYTLLEIHGCRETETQPDDAGLIPVVVDDANPQFFSVYARHRDHSALCLVDRPTLASAVQIAAIIGGKCGIPVVNHCTAA